ncbi:MAG: fumarylacetoacetate hydrolase family protein [Chloroflexota bacterium]|nr:fumarylacetoacetate hydrolase family protein [Chloroflexota bacterium]
MLVTYDDRGTQAVGVREADRVLGLATLGPEAPRTMNDLIDAWPRWGAPVRDLATRLRKDPQVGTTLAEVRLLAPIPRPRRNPFLIAGNYMAHVLAGEKATGIPLSQRKTAIFFSKPSGAVIGPDATIEYETRWTQKVDWECELVVVIGTTGRDIPVERAMEHVFGYTIGNDVSARDIQIQKPTSDFMRGKGMDTFFPIGPGIVLRDDYGDYHARRLRLSVNGERKQDGTLGEMTRDVPEIIAELSRGLTLEAGDIIATGTPSGVANESPDPQWLKDGDIVLCEIEGIGTLTNRVRALEGGAG